MFDLIALAFQCDATRICTFMYANEGSNRSYTSIDVPDGHHDLSHHGGDPKKHEKLKNINRFHIEQFAYLLGKLKSIPEGDRLVARQRDDRLRQRDQRRRPPQPRRPADPDRRQRGAGPSSPGGISKFSRSHSTISICRCSSAWELLSGALATAQARCGILTDREVTLPACQGMRQSFFSDSSCFLA